MSTEQSDPDSQADLGKMFSIDAGATRDYAKVRYWFLRAEENKNSVAQTNLGVIYQYGKGIPVDFVEAAKWFRRAAKAGNTIAKEQLDNVQRMLFQKELSPISSRISASEMTRAYPRRRVFSSASCSS